MAIGSAATAIATVGLVVCVAAFHMMGCSATTVADKPRPSHQKNQVGGLLADQSKIIGSLPAVYDVDNLGNQWVRGSKRVCGSFALTDIFAQESTVEDLHACILRIMHHDHVTCLGIASHSLELQRERGQEA